MKEQNSIGCFKKYSASYRLSVYVDEERNHSLCILSGLYVQAIWKACDTCQFLDQKGDKVY